MCARRLVASMRELDLLLTLYGFDALAPLASPQRKTYFSSATHLARYFARIDIKNYPTEKITNPDPLIVNHEACKGESLLHAKAKRVMDSTPSPVWNAIVCI